MTSEQNGLPNRTLVAFPITQEREYAERLAFSLSNKSHSARNRKAVAQRPSGYFNPGDCVSSMTREVRTILVKLIQPIARKETPSGKSRIKCSTGMSFAKDETVTIMFVWTHRINIQDSAVKHREDFSNRKAAANVRALCSMHHVQNVSADCSSERRQVL